jgi:UDP-N-acetylglucosamine 1-carboxyvinyltransferase
MTALKQTTQANTAVIQGGQRLSGEVRARGSKNCALPLMAAALLTDETCVLHNPPFIRDIEAMANLLASLGARVEADAARRTIAITADAITSSRTPTEIAASFRASFLVTGPLLTRVGEASSVHPGGCKIGERPVNVDLLGFEAMGAEVESQDQDYRLSAGRLQGARLYLDYPSHTGTENLMLAATLAEGTSVIRHASAEPEVVALANCLNQMGARIRGAGTNTIEIEGVEKLHGAEWNVIPDRHEAGTFALAAAITGGDVTIHNTNYDHIEPVLYKLGQCGVTIQGTSDPIRVSSAKPLRAVEVQAIHFPGFPTDLQPQICALLTQATGESVIHERVFEARFLYVEELRKMGAAIDVSGEKAYIHGPTDLRGTTVQALDIRSGVALLLAALTAKGTSRVQDMHHIFRGYESLPEDLMALGAQVTME